jgi:dipeptidyl aminopeptidase/acylaminoacyl peptidase
MVTWNREGFPMRRLSAVLLAVSLASAPLTHAAAAPSVLLIPRQDLFGNPTRTQPRLSPDGEWLSWIAPRDGVMNIWVAPAKDIAAARPLTNERTRPIPEHHWAPDSSMILFLKDKGGDENFVLYGVDVKSGEERTLSPTEKTRAEIIAISPLVKDRILVGLNDRDPKWHDAYSLDLRTGKLTLVMRNDGYGSLTADQRLDLRLASRPREDGGADYFRISDGKVEAQPFSTVGLEDSQTVAPSGFSNDGKTLYWIDSRGRDTAALVAQDVATGKTTVLGSSPKADISNVLIDPRTGRVDAYPVAYLTSSWTGLDPAVGSDLKLLQEKLKGDVEVQSRTDADDAWIVSVDVVTAPVAYYRFDRRSKALTKLFVNRPELEHATLAAMHPVEIRTRDGLTMVSYLTLPPGSDADGDGVPDHPVPMVLFPHGGPWGRDFYGFSPYHQLWANRGYAVLSPNFRASTGFGKAFVSAGDLQWGRRMQDDLDDAVAWAVAHGVTTADKVAIFGGSYGGYAVLAGMTFTPDRYQCGVDLFGISNMETVLATIPPYWEPIRKEFYKRMGDPTTPEGLAGLKAASPLYKADLIKRPLLIGQGGNDPRVKPAESEQIVAAMKSRSIPVTYVFFPDEGHGFRRPPNNIAMVATAETFMASCLGGRAEPFGEAIRASTMQVREGGGHVNGLEAAAAKAK